MAFYYGVVSQACLCGYGQEDSINSPLSSFDLIKTQGCYQICILAVISVCLPRSLLCCQWSGSESCYLFSINHLFHVTMPESTCYSNATFKSSWMSLSVLLRSTNVQSKIISCYLQAPEPHAIWGTLSAGHQQKGRN